MYLHVVDALVKSDKHVREICASHEAAGPGSIEPSMNTFERLIVLQILRNSINMLLIAPLLFQYSRGLC